MEFLTITTHPAPTGAVVITVRGEVDLCTAPLLLDALLAQLSPADPREVVIDLTDVAFFGAAGLTVLVTVGKAAARARAGLRLVADSRVVLLPLTITGLDRGFDIRPALVDAAPIPREGPDGQGCHA